jgi:hypothetical protein
MRNAEGAGKAAARAVIGFAMVCLLAGFAVPAAAQMTPADSAAVLLRTAQDFEREGESGIAAALYNHILERYGTTPAAEAARARLLEDADRVDPISRMELPVFGTLYGAWLGLAVPAALDAGSSEAYGAGFLIGAPLGLFSARAAQNARRYSEGQARAITWGGAFGTWQGFGWTTVLDIGEDQVCDQFGCYETGDSDQERITGMVLGGLVGIGTGAILARKPIRSGVSSAAQGGSIWGSVYGAMIAGFFDPESDNGLAATLLAGNAGLLAGAALGRAYDLSRPRVRWINLGALAGGLGGLGIDLLLQPDDDNVAIAIPLTTSVAGLMVAAHATRELRPGPDEGRGDDGFASSLLGYGPGGWRIAAPLPRPTLIPIDDANGRPSWRPGLSFEILRARF